MAERSGKTGVDYALELAAAGVQVIPLPVGAKLPAMKWRQYQTERVTEKRLRMWFSGVRCNYFVITGRISGVCVLDCDTPAAEAWWRERLGPILDQTARVKTAKGHHYWFKLPEGVGEIRGRSLHQVVEGKEIGWDFRCEGGGVVAPPSIHESGFVYTWERPLSVIQLAPEALLRPEKATEEAGAVSGRSMLVKLLSEPPVGQGSGRNDWLTRVGGHLVAGVRFEDGLLAALRVVNSTLEEPLPDEELMKMAPSLLAAENRAGRDESLSADCGWLVAGESCLLTQVRVKAGDDYKIGVAEYADFDIRAVGVVEDAEANRAYDVVLKRKRQGDEIRDLVLTAAELSDRRRLKAWLAEHGVTTMAPLERWPKEGDESDRLTRYLESQAPPHFEVVSSLGWHDGAFVTHDGTITAAGAGGFGRRKPDPRLRELAPFRYGFVGGREAAVGVLREVMSFHDETVCAVFGAWWAACFLKPQIHQVAALFPFMALEAPSESGKTTGFFSMMTELAGGRMGQLVATAASFRDYAGAHQSGIVWADDQQDPVAIHEILRAATGEGTMVKKGEDRTSQVAVKLVAPLCVSGETLGLASQKALLDRAVLLEVGSPTSRKSLTHPDRLQWQDILEFRRKHPDLNDYAGSLVQAVLGLSEMVAEIPSLVPEAGGRFGDKIAIVRLGGRVLSEVLGEGEWTERVDAWAADQVNLGSENTLTLQILPMALQHTNWRTHPQPAEGRWPATPVVVQEGVVWFSPSLLAQWWSVMHNGKIDPRVASLEALQQQAKTLGLYDCPGARKRQMRHVGGVGRSLYWGVDREPGGVDNGLSELLLARSRGEEPDRGVHPQLYAEQLFDVSRPPEDQ